MNGTTGVGAKVTIVALVIASLIGTVVMANAAEANYDCPNGAVTVIPGDTLWGIAEVYCTGDPRAIVHDMQIQNPHIGDTLFPGDEIRLPSPERADMVETIVVAMGFMLFIAMPLVTVAVATIAMAIATVQFARHETLNAKNVAFNAVMAATTVALALVTVLALETMPFHEFL